MAKENKGGVSESTATNGELVADIGSTDGFQRLTNDVDLFWVAEYKEKPNPMRGVVLDVRYRKPEALDAKRPELGMKEPQAYYIVKATGRFIVTFGESDNKQYRLCEKGELVWVDDRYALARLKDFAPKLTDKGTIAAEVIFSPKKKVPLGGGKSVWKGDLVGRVIEPRECHELGISAEMNKMLTAGASAEAAIKQLPEAPF